MPAVSPRALSPRARIIAVCAALVIVLFAVAALAPLPFTVAQPGSTVNVLGANGGKQVITISGSDTRKTKGQLRMTTIAATGPEATVRLGDVVSGWFRTDRAVLPREAVYVGDTTKEIERHNADEMRKSQNTATSAALGYLHKSPRDIKVTLRLADVGGPSAGLLFSLGIVNKLDGDGRGGDLTGGRTIAGTGTIDARGKVGAVGGVPLKTQAAKRDGATVFLVPKAECGDAEAEQPKGLRLVPVTTLDGAVKALQNLQSGGAVPHC
ncbi:S16 family serine protease [Streptomyces sp. NPDC019937]|uniref:S16 family serine protease n=1 Tax=Streptomyces sp. NPDC019937 TaxID=3154787 RepID=UPI0033EF1B71